MSRENVEIVRSFYDAFGAGDLDAATAVFADQVRVTDPDLGTVEGLPAFREYLDGLKAHFRTPERSSSESRNRAIR
jgi:ketosteroid isomerase-like protein